METVAQVQLIRYQHHSVCVLCVFFQWHSWNAQLQILLIISNLICPSECCCPEKVKLESVHFRPYQK